MEIIIIIAIILFLIYITSKNSTPTIQNKACIYHKWVEHKQPDSEDTYLKCSQCDKTPTEIVEGL